MGTVKKHMLNVFSGNSCKSIVLGIFAFFAVKGHSQLFVDEAATNADIISTIEGSGLTIVPSSFTITQGAANQSGLFGYTPDGVLGLDTGFVMTTGSLTSLFNNDSGSSSVGNPDITADPDLLSISPLASNDQIIVEFDVIPKCDTLQIDFVFGSEEYNEYVCSTFNDAFAFFVSGPGISGGLGYANDAANFAQLPDGTPVAINTVNDGNLTGPYPDSGCQSLTNTALFVDNTAGTTLEPDGITVPITAKGVVIPCETYHVKMVIGDAIDSSWDSWVFLESFSCPGQDVTMTPDPIFDTATEGCQYAFFIMERGGDTTVPIDVDLTFTGSATFGVDYDLLDVTLNPAPTTLSFAADEIQKILVIEAYEDGVTEGNESINLTASWSICTEVLSVTQEFTIEEPYINITCPPDINSGTNPGSCGANVFFGPPTVDSNCNGTSTSRTDGLPFTSGSFFPVGTYTFEYTSTTPGGLTDVCTFDVIVTDSEGPSITCPADQILVANTSCQATLPDYTSLVTTSDNCDPTITVTQSPAPGSSVSGSNTITFTATDDDSNSSQCTITVDVVDVTNPTVTCPADQTIAGNAACEGTLPDFTGLLTTADNCDASLTLAQSPVAGTTITGSSTVTFTITDDAGNSVQCSINVTVSDNIDPVITTCPSNQNINANATCQASLPDFTGSVVATDNCDPTVTITQSPLAGTTVSGTTTVIFTATDDAGNTDQCSIDVTVIDVTNPTVTCPADQTLNANATCQATLPDYTGLLTVSDNCDPSLTIAQSPVSGTTVSGTTTVTFTVTDDAGNSSQCTIDVMVIDVTDPIITCPGNQSLNANGSCQATLPDYTGLLATSDNCDPTLTITQSPVSGTTVSGTTSVTFTVTDDAGNSSQCSIDVTVIDITDPVISCPGNQTLIANGSCEATLPDYTSLITYSDNCSASITQLPAAGSTVSGTSTVVFTVTDGAGNSVQCSFDVNVVDASDPVITCPGNQTLNGNASCEATLPDYSGLLTSSDNCDASLTIVQSPLAGTTVSGTNTVTFTVTDDSGNSSQCSFDVNVIDVTDPSISCPGNQTLNANASCQASLPDYTGLLTTSDNCDPSLTLAQSPSAGTTVSGTTTVTFTATDDSGNSSQCSIDVTVIDVTDPVVICPGNQTVNGNASCESSLLDYTGLLTTSDNCDASLNIAQSPIVGTTISGTTSVTFTVTDDAGNSSQCSIDVTVVDVTDPVVICPSNQTLNGNASCQASLPDYTGLLTTSDNCDPSLAIAQSPIAGTLVSGTTTVTFTVTDDAGNSSQCSIDVTVIDITDPTVTCPSNQTLNANGSCQATLPDYTGMLTASDNCDPSLSISQSPLAGSTVSGTTTVTFTVTDDAGNFVQCSIDVTVIDVSDPTVTCPADQTLNGNSSCEATLQDYTGLLTVSDNCDPSLTISQSPAAG